MKIIEVFNTISKFGDCFKSLVKHYKIWISLCMLLVFALICTTPIKNPFAKEKLTIYGDFPYDKGFELEFYQYAYSTADWYSYVCSGFGIISEKSTCTANREILHPQRTNGRHYELTVYRDRYFLGLVGWRSTHSFFRAYKKNVSTNITFLTPEASPSSLTCDGNGRRLSQRQGRIFCSPDDDRQEFKYLVLTEDHSSQFSEQINFHLYTE